MLAYPLVQLIHAIIGLVPTPRYYPLRCVCVQMLNRLAQTKGKLPAQLTSNPGQPVSNKEKPTAAAPSFFINSAGYLLEILNFCTAFFQKESVKFRPYAGKPPSVQHYMLMAPDKLLGTKVFMVHHHDSYETRPTIYVFRTVFWLGYTIYSCRTLSPMLVQLLSQSWPCPLLYMSRISSNIRYPHHAVE